MGIDKSAKILVLGQSGVGKSSFINYFLGTNVAEVGAGKPITQDYCVEYALNDGRLPIKIFDNKGFEAAIADKQKQVIIDFVSKHNNSNDVFDWFHTIFYCTSAYRRFEDFEAEFVLDLSKSISQNIHIIMTTCDGLNREVLDEKKEYIRNKLKALGDKCRIFEVVSISKKKRNGEIVKPYGREAIIESVFRLLWSDISSKISKDYARELHSNMFEVVNKLQNESRRKITTFNLLKNLNNESQDLDIFGEQLYEEIEKIIDECNSKYNGILRPIVDLCQSYLQYVASAEKFELDFDSITSYFDFLDFDENDDDLYKYFPSISQIDESDDFDFKSFFRCLGEIITCASRFRKTFDEIFEKIKRNIPTEGEIEQIAQQKLLSFLDHYSVGNNNAQ